MKLSRSVLAVGLVTLCTGKSDVSIFSQDLGSLAPSKKKWSLTERGQMVLTWTACAAVVGATCAWTVAARNRPLIMPEWTPPQPVSYKGDDQLTSRPVSYKQGRSGLLIAMFIVPIAVNSLRRLHRFNSARRNNRGNRNRMIERRLQRFNDTGDAC